MQRYFRVPRKQSLMLRALIRGRYFPICNWTRTCCSILQFDLERVGRSKSAQHGLVGANVVSGYPESGHGFDARDTRDTRVEEIRFG
jgi:hypothetical protein